MIQLLGTILFIIFFIISLLHLYWAIGGKWNFLAALPTNEKGEKIMNPGFFSTIIVAIGFLFFCNFYFDKNNIDFNKYTYMVIELWLLDIGIYIFC